MHIFLFGYIRESIVYQTTSNDNVLFARSSFFVNFFAATTASLFLHPLHWAESRMVLNNRLPNFGAYKSIFTLFVSNRDSKVLSRGMSIHFPVNFILAFTGFNYFSSTNFYTYSMTQMIFHTLIYPLVTV